jgi:sugar O-acyltransferase (sialic acid O-acetyltransferase NeuD family)
MQDLVIIGCGGHGREILDLAEAMNADQPQWSVLGFLDENPKHHCTSVRGYEVLGDLQWFAQRVTTNVKAFIGIGQGSIRQRIHTTLREQRIESAILVHPAATVTPHVVLEPGVAVTAGVVLTNNIHLGTHTHVNIGATISHDCVIGPYSIIGPGAHLAGNVHIGTGCEVGIGASILPSTTVGEWTIIGAGAVVTQHIPANSVAVGVPARIIKTRFEVAVP